MEFPDHRRRHLAGSEDRNFVRVFDEEEKNWNGKGSEEVFVGGTITVGPRKI